MIGGSSTIDTFDLGELYRRLGVSAMARSEGVSRDVIYARLKDAGIELDGARRGNYAQRRPCPADFRERYIADGFWPCVDHFQTDHATVRRWRDETGADELRIARSARIKHAKAKPDRVVSTTVPQSPGTEVERAAAHWLRFPKNGGWVVTKRGGMWFVGTMRMTSAQMVTFAGKRGFSRMGR